MKTDSVPEITKDVAEAAKKGPRETPFLIADQGIPGLFLKVGARDLSWIVRRKFQGTTRTLTIGTFPSVLAKDIRPHARKYLSDLELGIHPKEKAREIKKAATEKRAASHWTLGLAFDWYLASQDEESEKRLDNAEMGVKPCPRKNPLAGKTLDGYRSTKNRFEKAGILRIPVAELTAEDLLNAHSKILKNADPKRATAGGKTSGAQSMRSARAVVRALIQSHLPNVKDPFAAIPKGRKWDEPKPRNRTIIERESSLKKWWDAVDSLRAKTDRRAKDAPAIADWLQLTLLFGSRRSESLAMTWDQIDLEDGVATFDETKSKRPHAIPFGPHARSILERRRKAADEAGDASPYVFPATRTGYKSKERTYIQQTKTAENEVIKKSGVDFSAHDLRRTSSTLLGEAGSNVYQIKAALNHAADGRDVTGRHYMRIRLKALRSVFEKLEESILEEAGVRQPEPDGLADLIALLKAKASDPAVLSKLKAALEA
jgi:integrase